MAAVLVTIMLIMSYRDSNEDSNEDSITGTRTKGVGGKQGGGGLGAGSPTQIFFTFFLLFLKLFFPFFKLFLKLFQTFFKLFFLLF